MESANHEVVPGGTKGSSGVCFSMLHYFFATPKIFVPFQCWKLDSLSRVQVVQVFPALLKDCTQKEEGKEGGREVGKKGRRKDSG